MENNRIDYTTYHLPELEQDCWDRLVTGAVKSRTPFHTPSIATLHQGEVNLRTVVLRKTLATERELRFHTDIRSPKWQELSQNPSISALFYDAVDRIQLRVKGKAVLHHTNEITAEAWQKTSLSSRKCYLTRFSPSSYTDVSTSGLTDDIEHENFTLAESESGYSNFGIVSIQVQSIDWLWLNHAGHRRAFFDYEKGSFQWMIP
ncbi:pyridoxamine 5'-phosphate oxidase family protein [Aquirufa novilacunae]|jgi:3-hydroxyisobutyrate dehydrogenase|uniref:Pyridoxamine 5'-phosphate oxidase family protein n=1 Tax=Aquirufa novilacunae TaxID=3139305 RepID=A0ABW8U1D1_9BACT